MTDRSTAVVITAEASEHGEGPLWDARSDRLMWVDQYRGLVREALIDGAGRAVVTRTLDVGAPVGAVVPRERGGWLVAAGDGIAVLDDDGRLGERIRVLPDDGIRRRMNDGKVDPLGRFWAGTMAWDKLPARGSLHLLDRGRLITTISGTTISNGLAWDPSGERMWFIDTPTREIVRYRVSGASVEREGVAVTIASGAGNPDGMCIDDDGDLWVALWGGSAVHRYSPGGELLAVVEVDARQVSSCCFGGDDLGTLFITTSAEGYGPAELAADPLAGHVFAVRTGAAGVAASAYRD